MPLPFGDNRAEGANSSRGSVTALFGHFELLEQAGRGGMGVVFKARQTDLERTVALKMILSSRLASPEEVRRFQQEAKAAARLRHPNIVGIHQVGQINGQHYFTMDYIGGHSLAKLLEAGPLPPDQAAQCLLSVARAVHFLHDQGIVHRDLKPSNILLDERGQPFVTDFGLARVFSDDAARTETGAILGTPSYMAPEQARGDSAAISPRTDVYSLGAVLYEMLTGRPPFREENQLNTLMQVLEGEPTLPNRLNRGVPAELQRICMFCLEKSPAGRYASAAALADDLERYLRREPLSVRPVGIRQTLRRWSRRQPALVAHGAGLLLTGLVVQVKFMLSGTDLPLHLQIMGILGLWLVLSCLFQWLLLARGDDRSPCVGDDRRRAAYRSAVSFRHAAGTAADRLSARGNRVGPLVPRAAGDVHDRACAGFLCGSALGSPGRAARAIGPLPADLRRRAAGDRLRGGLSNPPAARAEPVFRAAADTIISWASAV